MEQKEQDFRNLAALYAKTYAPLEWKKTLFDFDLLKIGPWVEAIRASKSDLEFMEVCYRYVASLRDSHSNFFFNSSFVADSGLTVDIYSEHVMVEAINRTRLPLAQYPIRAGDELVAIDGKPVAEIIAEFLPLIADANDRLRRRTAASLLTYRPQSSIPRSVELPDESVFQIQHQDGTLASYTITWTKTGFPLRQFSPVASPKVLPPTAMASSAGFTSDPLAELRNLSLNLHARKLPPALRHPQESEGEVRHSGEAMEGAVLGFGSRVPVFAIPSNFTVRRGRGVSDNFFTATYEVGGKRLGYLRIPSFVPSSQLLALSELITEVTFLNANTDGLVVDVTRNPGGDACYLNTVLSALIPYKYTAIGFQIRPTLRYVNSFTSQLETAKNNGTSADTIQTLTQNLDAVKEAYAAGRGLTPTLPLCAPTLEVEPFSFSYSKPLIVLADDFSASAADVFAATMQDSQRGPIVGMPTAGAGGTVIGSLTTGNYSESFAYTTTSLLTRKAPVNYPGLPSTPYLENIGARPDIFLDYMTTENLKELGRPFVGDFTGAILTEIAKREK